MPLLVRKINKGKWNHIDFLASSDISADALTNDLKTTNNTLSLWQVNNEGELDNAILALVAKQDNHETFDVVIFDEAKIYEQQLELQDTPGDTPVKSLIDTHRDICDLTYSKMGLVKDLILIELRGDRVRRFTKTYLKALLKRSIENQTLSALDINDTLKRKLGL